MIQNATVVTTSDKLPPELQFVLRRQYQPQAVQLLCVGATLWSCPGGVLLTSWMPCLLVPVSAGGTDVLGKALGPSAWDSEWL